MKKVSAATMWHTFFLFLHERKYGSWLKNVKIGGNGLNQEKTDNTVLTVKRRGPLA